MKNQVHAVVGLGVTVALHSLMPTPVFLSSTMEKAYAASTRASYMKKEKSNSKHSDSFALFNNSNIT